MACSGIVNEIMAAIQLFGRVVVVFLLSTVAQRYLDAELRASNISRTARAVPMLPRTYTEGRQNH